MTAFLSPIGNGQTFFKNDGTVNIGGLITTYIAGTTTATSTWADSAQSAVNTNPIVLTASGKLPSECWLQSGVAYKFVVTDSLNIPVAPSTYDNISGVNDVVVAPPVVSSWTLGTVPTIISGASFSLTGNQTSTYVPGRRCMFYVTSGTVYGSISTSVYTVLTTITLIMDYPQILDSGLNSVYYGFDFALASTARTSNPLWFASGGGTGDAITANILGTYLTALIDGMEFTVRTPSANTITNPTINISLNGVALGARVIKKGNLAALQVGDYTPDQQLILVYNLADGSFQLANPINSPSGNLALLGTLAVTGATTVGSTLAVSGAVTIPNGALVNQAVAYGQLATLLPAGTIIDYAGIVVPAGYLICPVIQTDISRTTYAALFNNIGTTWGVGDGATTFGMPWFPVDYVSVQSNANVASSTVGAVISHSHNVESRQYTGTTGNLANGDINASVVSGSYTSNTGGASNFAAGVRILKCVKT